MESRLLKQLISILNEESEYYQEIKDLSYQKKDLIIDNQVEELSALISEEEGVVNKLKELEDKRTEVINDLSEYYQLAEDNPGFSELVKYIPDSWKEELSTIREDLLTKIEAIYLQNEQNRNLIEEAMKLNDFSLNMMTEIINSANKTYSKNPESKKSDNVRHIIDRRG